jgi:uncharacterized membrane protein
VRFINASVEYQGFWGSFWDLIWWFLWAFIFVAYLFALFAIIGDLFRDRKLSGWLKAIWIFFLIFFPIITALVYLIARGRSMGERSMAAAQQQREATDAYIQQVAGASAADEIAKAQSLLDAGTITQAEFDQLKARALA